MIYTAAEMREMAERCKQCAYAADEYGDRSAMERFATIEAMLRQAAEAMDRHTLPGVPTYPMPICGCTGPCGNVACPHMMKVTS